MYAQFFMAHAMPWSAHMTGIASALFVLYAGHVLWIKNRTHTHNVQFGSANKRPLAERNRQGIVKRVDLDVETRWR